MRLFAAVALLFVTSGALAQSADDAEALELLMIESEIDAMEQGMTPYVATSVSIYPGVTMTETVMLEEGVEYMIAVHALPGEGVDPDFY
ncbi:MAG: hypothetical protein AAFQ43_06435, partial [Bacteroidota bacterium]